MNTSQILTLISDYKKAAEKLVSIFQKEMDGPDIYRLRIKQLYPKTGALPAHGISCYNFHGIGLFAIINGKEIDVDFAYTPDFRCDGFDAQRLCQYAAGFPQLYSNTANEHDIRKAMEDLLAAQLIGRVHTPFHSHLYFSSANISRVDCSFPY